MCKSKYLSKSRFLKAFLSTLNWQIGDIFVHYHVNIVEYYHKFFMASFCNTLPVKKLIAESIWKIWDQFEPENNFQTLEKSGMEPLNHYGIVSNRFFKWMF